MEVSLNLRRLSAGPRCASRPGPALTPSRAASADQGAQATASLEPMRRLGRHFTSFRCLRDLAGPLGRGGRLWPVQWTPSAEAVANPTIAAASIWMGASKLSGNVMEPAPAMKRSRPAKRISSMMLIRSDDAHVRGGNDARRKGC